MQGFYPRQIYVDHMVKDYPLTEKVLSNLSDVPVKFVDDAFLLKKPMPISEGKKNLLITRHQGPTVRACQGMGDYVCCHYLTISLVSNCHFECTYCILQDYLKNNPIMTFFANVEEILNGVEETISAHPEQLFRVGTGELSDSLALDSITGLSKDLVLFAAKQKNMILELKTKSDEVHNLLGLNHRGKTVVSWSVNPEDYVKTEELKCASLKERLEAARLCASKGYPVGFHLDPLMAFPDWKRQYHGLIHLIRSVICPEEIAWISLGSLRFTPRLKEISQTRFPKSRLFLGELFPSPDGKVRYLRDIREEMYSFVKNEIDHIFPTVPNYLCMDTQSVWENTYGFAPQSRNRLEEALIQRFMV